MICKLNHLRAERPPLPPRATRSPGVHINGGEGGGRQEKRTSRATRDLLVSILIEEKEEAAKRTTTSGDIDLSVGDGGHQNFH